MYKKVLLAYDGSIEGRRALREGAKLAQLCCAEVFLLAVVELSPIMSPDAGLALLIDEQTANYKAVLAEGVERLKAARFQSLITPVMARTASSPSPSTAPSMNSAIGSGLNAACPPAST